jgi:hypothetical protein
LSEFKLKYDVEDKVLKNTSGLWTYKGQKDSSDVIFTFGCLLTHILRKVMTVI